MSFNAIEAAIWNGLHIVTPVLTTGCFLTNTLTASVVLVTS